MKSCRVGSIVLSTDQGLGVLAKSFYDNGIVSEVYVQPHSSRENHYEWYPKRVKTMEELLEKIDVLLLFETAFDWRIIPKARKKGIKTVLMPMYECSPFPQPYETDLIICPSLLDLDYYCDKNAYFLPVPVNVPWKERNKALTFVHNAGNGGLGGRNGTNELIEALPYIEKPVKIIINSQVPLRKITDPRVTVNIGTQPYDTIFNEGDVFIFPEKFNGLSLPLQEAYASGMLVMCGDRHPMNSWLPNEPLIPVSKYVQERITNRKFSSAVFDPKTIARTIDAWYGKDITKFSHMGREWAKKTSWNVLKKEYLELLKQ